MFVVAGVLVGGRRGAASRHLARRGGRGFLGMLCSGAIALLRIVEFLMLACELHALRALRSPPYAL
jgi:hypothetical protein